MGVDQVGSKWKQAKPQPVEKEEESPPPAPKPKAVKREPRRMQSLKTEPSARSSSLAVS